MNVLNEGFFSLVYRLCERIMNLAYLNLLWIFFSLIGLGIFGVFPATATMFALLRQEMLKDLMPTFKLFFKYFKKNFWKSNLIGWIVLFTSYIIYLDFKLITYLKGNMKIIMYFSLLAVAFIFLFASFYLFPVYAHYDLKIKNYFFISLIIIFIHPIQTLLIGAASLLHLYLIFNFPALIPFFGVSVWAFCISHISHSAFSKATA